MNIESATQAKQFVLVTANDEEGRAVKAYCPGHKCKTHLIEIDRRTDGMCLTCQEVRQYDEKNLKWTEVTQACSGATFGVCYHILATVLFITEKLGAVNFYHEKCEAEKNKKDGDRMFAIWSKEQPRPDKMVWLVFTPKKRTLDQVAGKPLRKLT